VTRYLQEDDTTIISDEKCDADCDYPVYPWHLCTSTGMGYVILHNDLNPFCYRNICTFQGDNGGPLFVNGILVGVLNYCPVACVEHTCLFLDVSNYIDWINSQIIVCTCEKARHSIVNKLEF
jgi:Trypsin